MTMSTGSWIQLDTRRESWIFVLLGDTSSAGEGRSPAEEKAEPAYWELGIGNPQTFVGASAARCGCGGITTKDELTERLLTELDQYRYQNALLITPNRATVQRLRRWFLESSQQKPSLRGFSHLNLQAKLTEYFDQDVTDHSFGRSMRSPPRETETAPSEAVTTGAAREFWEVWQQVFRLLPVAELRGAQL
jgi:hypothetical protein